LKIIFNIFKTVPNTARSTIFF